MEQWLKGLEGVQSTGEREGPAEEMSFSTFLYFISRSIMLKFRVSSKSSLGKAANVWNPDWDPPDPIINCPGIRTESVYYIAEHKGWRVRIPIRMVP